MTWPQIYNFLGIRDFIYFIDSPQLQDTLFPIKFVFILFAAFFLCAIVYFYIESSYLQYQFLQDVAEFFSWQAYGLRQFERRWKGIAKKIESGSEKDYKFAILEADDFLQQVLENADYQGQNMEELIEDAGKKNLPNYKEILEAHNVRNSIVHNVNYALDLNTARRILSDYEKTIKGLYT